MNRAALAATLAQISKVRYAMPSAASPAYEANQIPMLARLNAYTIQVGQPRSLKRFTPMAILGMMASHTTPSATALIAGLASQRQLYEGLHQSQQNHQNTEHDACHPKLKPAYSTLEAEKQAR
jgi:hypothetical protein